MNKKSIICIGILLVITALIAFGGIFIGYDHRQDEIPEPGYRLGSDEVFMQIYDISISGLENKEIIIENAEDLEAAFRAYPDLNKLTDLDTLLDAYPLEENILVIGFVWCGPVEEFKPLAMVIVPETNTIYMDWDVSGGYQGEVAPALAVPCAPVALIPKDKVEGLDYSEYKLYYMDDEGEEP